MFQFFKLPVTNLLTLKLKFVHYCSMILPGSLQLLIESRFAIYQVWNASVFARMQPREQIVSLSEWRSRSRAPHCIALQHSKFTITAKINSCIRKWGERILFLLHLALLSRLWQCSLIALHNCNFCVSHTTEYYLLDAHQVKGGKFSQAIGRLGYYIEVF